MPRLSKKKVKPQVEKLNKNLKEQGLKLFETGLPNRITTLTELLETPEFKVISTGDFKLPEDTIQHLDKLLQSTRELRSAKRKISHISSASKSNSSSCTSQSAGATELDLKPAIQFSTNAVDGVKMASIPSNPRILNMMKDLKRHFMDALDLTGTLKLWIQLNIPRFEDGNNFGVDVQTECITELSELEDKCCTVLESTTKYFSGRAKLLSKCIKWPDIQDYRRSVEEVDHMECINIKVSLRDLRNHYTIIYDMLHKNFDRLEKPKGHSAALNMY